MVPQNAVTQAERENFGPRVLPELENFSPSVTAKNRREGQVRTGDCDSLPMAARGGAACAPVTGGASVCPLFSQVPILISIENRDIL